MKKVTVFQTNCEKDFATNMMATVTGCYVQLVDMEQVVMLRYSDDMSDDDILSELFSKMNDVEYRYSLNYSMSVGDVISIDTNDYRVLPQGFGVINSTDDATDDATDNYVSDDDYYDYSEVDTHDGYPCDGCTGEMDESYCIRTNCPNRKYIG